MSDNVGKSSSSGSSTPTNGRPARSTTELLGKCKQLLALKEKQTSSLCEIKERLRAAISSPSLTNFGLLASLEVGSSPSRKISRSVSCSDLSVASETSGSSSDSPDTLRTNMLWDYVEIQDGCKVQPGLKTLSVEVQQRVILKELVQCLVGVRGTYIVPLPPGENDGDGETYFTINCQLDKSMTEMVKKILPLATYFMGMQRMMAACDGRGQVLNALNAALQDLTSDFYVLIATVDEEMTREQMTLQKLQYYLEPTMWVMEEIWKVLRDIQLNKCQGAAVLNHLYGRIRLLEGNTAVHKMMSNLLNVASVPYMHKLQLWIHDGQLVDRSKEFLVQDNDMGQLYTGFGQKSDDYWEKRYTVRHDGVTTFLMKHTDMILAAGKYLNVLRQCGKKTLPIQKTKLEEKLQPTNGGRIAKVINEAYHFAAGMLLNLLMTEHDLMGRLKSVKSYLLLGQGDFITQFMDACETELSKNVGKVQPMILENLLGLTLRLSLARHDPYSDDVHCELHTFDLVTQLTKILHQKGEEKEEDMGKLNLTGIECFSFSYEAKWPCSLVLNNLAITKYQLLFRQLFFCKHAERQLCKVWKVNQTLKGRPSRQLTELHRSLWTLRQRMMNAIQNIEYYMIYEVIVPNWHVFTEHLKTVENVDQVLKHHQNFLDDCLNSCMMIETSLLSRAIFKLCKICIEFCDFIQQESLLEPSETFAERINYYNLKFKDILVAFLQHITYSADINRNSFINLVHRINFNGFYTEQIEKSPKNTLQDQDKDKDQDHDEDQDPDED